MHGARRRVPLQGCARGLEISLPRGRIGATDNVVSNWLKTDVHLHTSEDPIDVIHYSAERLLERAIELNFRVLAVTLHERVFFDLALFEKARERGVLMIPAVEKRIRGADVVILNTTP